jgi:hypothetical protein
MNAAIIEEYLCELPSWYDFEYCAMDHVVSFENKLHQKLSIIENRIFRLEVLAVHRTDLIEDYKNGFVFESNNSTSLKSAMKYMAEHIEKSNLMGKNAVTFISNWSYERICTSIESTL